MKLTVNELARGCQAIEKMIEFGERISDINLELKQELEDDINFSDLRFRTLALKRFLEKLMQVEIEL
jgi:hypothetical protein